MPYNDDHAGPFPIAAFNIDMLLWVEGEQYSGREISSMLREAGFRSIEVKTTRGYWSIVTGVKRQDFGWGRLMCPEDRLPFSFQ